MSDDLHGGGAEVTVDQALEELRRALVDQHPVTPASMPLLMDFDDRAENLHEQDARHIYRALASLVRALIEEGRRGPL